LRERAQAIIDIAHPDDREKLIKQARDLKIIYPNQIYHGRSAHLYPDHIAYTKNFKGGKTVRFRAMKPSDEEAMRRFFLPVLQGNGLLPLFLFHQNHEPR